MAGVCRYHKDLNPLSLLALFARINHLTPKVRLESVRFRIRLREGGLVHAVDGGELRNEEVDNLRPVRDWAVLLARLPDAPLGLVCAGKLLIDLRGRRLCGRQHADQLCIIQQVALHTRGGLVGRNSPALADMCWLFNA